MKALVREGIGWSEPRESSGILRLPMTTLNGKKKIKTKKTVHDTLCPEPGVSREPADLECQLDPSRYVTKSRY